NMKIQNVKSWVLRIPFSYPLMKETHALANFIEIESDGLKGHAMSVYPSFKQGIREFINRDAAPVIKDMDVMRPEEVRNRLFWATANKCFAGGWNWATSLIDIALWDLKGKALKQPIWKLLGGARSQVPAYITFGLRTYTKEQLLEVAKTLTSSG